MSELIKITPDGAEEQMVSEPETVHIKQVLHHPRYGRKLSFELPPTWENEAPAGAVKELDYNSTHRKWDDVSDSWTIDFQYLNLLVDHMTDAGFTVTVDLDVAKEFEDADKVFLPDER